MILKEFDCFKINMMYLKFVGLWLGENRSRCYACYSKIFLMFFIIINYMVATVNLFFLPRNLELIIEELLFYFTEFAIIAKALTIYFKHDEIRDFLNMLQSDLFQPETNETLKIVRNAEKSIKIYTIIVAITSYTANLSHILAPLMAHIFFSIDLPLPICNYYFMSEKIKEMLFYPIYTYQALAMHFYMLINVNHDVFLLRIMISAITQLEMLNSNLRRLTDYNESTESVFEKENVFKQRLHRCFLHFEKIEKFCRLIEKVFSEGFFVQFSSSSCILCVVLFRFTLPIHTQYYLFLISYMVAMLIPIFMPTWFGTRLSEASSALSLAIYNCDWISRPRQFKVNMMLFSERMKKPLSITACKMFPLLLTTFTKIMNTAYSFFTLLRNMEN